MTFYCKLHRDFEAIDRGQLFDHVEKDHPEIISGDLKKGTEGRARLEKFYAENLYGLEGPLRLSDSPIIAKTWGRPPKMGQCVADNERAKK